MAVIRTATPGTARLHVLARRDGRRKKHAASVHCSVLVAFQTVFGCLQIHYSLAVMFVDKFSDHLRPIQRTTSWLIFLIVGNRTEDRQRAARLQANFDPLRNPFLLYHGPRQHRPHVPILADLVRPPIR